MPAVPPGAPPRCLSGLAELAPAYRAFLVDQWGVVHDGHRVHPGAIDCLRRLRAHGPVVLISNTSRAQDEAAAALRRLGVPDDAWDAQLTSGELALRWLEAAHARGLRRALCLPAPSEPDAVLCRAPTAEVFDVEAADLLVGTGISDGPADAWDPVLARARARGLPLLLTNPDLVSVRPDGGFHLCPGTYGARYAALGGEVIRLGKPEAPLYAEALRLAFGAAPGGRPGPALAIGDSLHHDLAGARGAGLDAVLITRGVHGAELDAPPGADPSPASVAALAAREGEPVRYYLGALRWAPEGGRGTTTSTPP